MYLGEVGQSRARGALWARTLDPPPAGRRGTPPQREALSHKPLLSNQGSAQTFPKAAADSLPSYGTAYQLQAEKVRTEYQQSPIPAPDVPNPPRLAVQPVYPQRIAYHESDLEGGD